MHQEKNEPKPMEFPKIKKMLSEPKVYALLVRARSGELLHIGVHFSLEEAYSVASKRMEILHGFDPEEPVDIDLWNSVPASEIVIKLIKRWLFHLKKRIFGFNRQDENTSIHMNVK